MVFQALVFRVRFGFSINAASDHHLIARSLLDPAVKLTDIPIQIVHILKDGAAESVEAFQNSSP